jgi:hypothetical protein
MNRLVLDHSLHVPHGAAFHTTNASGKEGFLHSRFGEAPFLSYSFSKAGRKDGDNCGVGSS